MSLSCTAPLLSWTGLGTGPGLRTSPAWESSVSWGGKRGDVTIGAKWAEVQGRVVLPGDGRGAGLTLSQDTLKAAMGGDFTMGMAGALRGGVGAGVCGGVLLLSLWLSSLLLS